MVVGTFGPTLTTCPIFVAGDEEVGTLRRLPILGLVDFAVGAIDAYAQHLDQHAAPAWILARSGSGTSSRCIEFGLPG